MAITPSLQIINILDHKHTKYICCWTPNVDLFYKFIIAHVSKHTLVSGDEPLSLYTCLPDRTNDKYNNIE